MNDLEMPALVAWLGTVLGTRISHCEVEKFPGGQSNPTYGLTVDGNRYVLRRKPFGDLLPSAHAIEREFKLLLALAPGGFPVPRPIALCEDTGVIGSTFYLMEMVEGENYWDGLLPEVPLHSRSGYYQAMTDCLARLHGIDPKVPGLEGFAARDNYLERQITRWTKQYRAAQTDQISEMEALIEWLPETVPAAQGAAIIHGDYRIDNLIFSPTSPEIKAVLDWELWTVGDPLADFAYFAMAWVLPRDLRFGLAGTDLADKGVPSLSHIVERYCVQTGRNGIPNLHWYFSFNLFRLVGILQGVKQRVIAGNASSASAASVVDQIEGIARTAWAEARLAGAQQA